MENHFRNGDAVSADSPFVANDIWRNSNLGSTSLDLLHEGRTLDFSANENTADKYLAQLFIDVREGTSSEPSTEPLTSEVEAPQSANSLFESTERLTITQLSEATISIFNDVDTNHDGSLTKEELAASIEDDSFKGQEAQALSALYHYIPSFQDLNNDLVLDNYNGTRSFVSDNDGITVNDMVRFDTMITESLANSKPLLDSIHFVQSRMSDFDRDNNNKLSFNEIDTALDNEKLDVTARNVLTYIENNFEVIGAAHDDHESDGQEKEIGLMDLKMRFNQNSDISHMMDPPKSLMFRTFETEQPGISRELYADAQHPERSVIPDAIMQGTTGDCYFLASLAALAVTDPQSIVRMIKDNQDGTYTVTFPGDSTHPITVNAPTDAELGLFNAGSSAGIWATVLEKAYGKYLRQFAGTKGLTDIEGAGNGGWPHIALKMLTGRNFIRDKVKGYDKESLEELLTNNLMSDTPKPIAVSTSAAPSGEYFTVDGFPRRHAYTVMGIKPDAKGEVMVTIRNPWGKDDDTTSGTIDITMDQLVNNFTTITFEGSHDKKPKKAGKVHWI